MNRIVKTACLSFLLCGLVRAQESAPQPSGNQQNKPQTMQPATPQPAPTAQPGPAAQPQQGKSSHAGDPAKKKRSAAKKKTTEPPAPVEAAVPAAAPVVPAPPPPPAAPPLPPTLMNQPPVSPTVTMRDGLLTIDAPNSTLSEVLNGVRQATGAELEGVTPSDRVAVRLGPGSPREVVAALLQGTPYDYLILGSDQNPEAVTHILLTQGSPSSGPTPSPQPEAVTEPPASEAPEFFPDQGGVATGTATEGEQPQPSPMPPQPQPVNPNQTWPTPPQIPPTLPTPQPQQ